MTPGRASSATARRLAEVQGALMLLTRLPAGRLADPGPRLADCAWAFPLCGALVGTVAAAVLLAGQAAGVPPLAAALLALGTGVLLTGALHEDGLADVADGFGGGATRARKLEIMRDSRIGSYGAVALVLSLGLRTTAIAPLEGWHALAAFLAVGAASRLAMSAAMAALPPARQDGLGHGAGRVAPARLAGGLAITVLCLVPLGAAALPLALAMAVAALAVGWLARRQVGGQTGDVLGATQQITEIAGWLTLAALLPA